MSRAKCMPHRNDYPKGPAVEPGTQSTAYAHGICVECGKRRFLYLPARICEKCLLAESLRLRTEMEQRVLEELERLDAEDTEGAA